MAFHSALSRKRRCPYQAKVMKMLEMNSRTTVVTAASRSSRQVPGFAPCRNGDIPLQALAHGVRVAVRDARLAVGHKNLARRRPRSPDPPQQILAVAMPGE